MKTLDRFLVRHDDFHRWRIDLRSKRFETFREVVGARYRLLERIGSGATADVYRARDERLGRDVAAKVVVPWLAGAIKKVTGSSFAAPYVAGLLARLLSGCPSLSPLHTKTVLQKLASPLRS